VNLDRVERRRGAVHEGVRFEVPRGDPDGHAIRKEIMTGRPSRSLSQPFEKGLRAPKLKARSDPGGGRRRCRIQPSNWRGLRASLANRATDRSQ
jgi:hypothetical protein